MTREALRARLGAEWPGAIEHLAVTASTNDVMKDRARQGAPEWSVVTAEVQTAGRGRQGREWRSAAGNLHLSVLLRPRVDPARAGRLPLMAGLALAEALEAAGFDARLKWPNDVWIAGRKVAGILVESASTGSRLDSAVIGIGVNVTGVPEGLSAGMRDTVACLADFGPAPALDALAGAVLARMRVWYHRVAADGGELMAAWRARALPWWGATVEAKSGDQVLRGRAVDVDESGALILRRDDGATQLLYAGDVREVRPGP
jgi:BirA family biotin operon repressor/biotin-[acetyl-CoA-carboxylase] ligase